MQVNQRKYVLMVIYKFGGASVKNAEGVVNLTNIVYTRQQARVVVLSAFGKTTNQLEKLAGFIYHKDRSGFRQQLRLLRDYHYQIMQELFASDDLVYEGVQSSFNWLQEAFDREWHSYDYLYDQVVSIGELLSTYVVAHYLERTGLTCRLVDMREHLITDDTYREAQVNWEASSRRIIRNFQPRDNELILTQGFIGGSMKGASTTLGREGSDYSAAILAHILDAGSLVIWKDVPGVLNADPRFFSGTQKLGRISYQEAIELAYYGAKIIHPKTIKPLQNKGIPLNVRSFIEPDQPGTWIGDYPDYDGAVPIFIIKNQQVLISVLPKDYSLVVEEQLSKIYGLFAKNRVKVNMMQHSALNFSVCMDDTAGVSSLMSDLREDYRVLYNKGLQLMTVRHYTEQIVRDVQKYRRILVEQRSRHTAQFLMETTSSPMPDNLIGYNGR